ncbi:MAG: LLM class flavin-dependent oxidoreductase, partial [Dehalococcoidia bacterium]|nr:LLM class flavin-dependent oxidoreductase [Dehalococcoidia bacterium]
MALGVSLFCDQLPDLATTLAIGAAMDAGGMDYIFVTESRNDVFTVLAQLATRAGRARIGSAIANMYWRHPYATALATANIDTLSGGRAILGLGTGHTIAVEQFLGLSMRHPLAKMRDYVACVRAALDAGRDRIEVVGDHYQIAGSRVQWPTPHRVPIVLAALSPGMVKLGVTAGDGI